MDSTQADERRQKASLGLAQAVQQALLPRECPRCSGTHVAAKYRPVGHIGGDFYDFIHLDADQIGLLIGDVVGHGIHSALVMALLLGNLRANRRERLHPAKIISEVNNLLVELGDSTGEILLCSLFYGILDMPSRVLFYIDAGHPPPLCCRAKGITSLVSNAMLLGAQDFEGEEQCHQFEAEDRLVLYTDGVVETRDKQGELYSVKRLRRALQSQWGCSAEQTVQYIFSELEAFSSKDGPEDDATVVVVDFA